ncbi:DUF262 domain-containing protein [Streptomyces sp. NPDC048172]|uniref:DUF262 domain-containing protein n=1 Tax=Streptomyces sp. NPDC048172 TaxID=3365505 RepID=UPI00371BF446
MGTDEIKSRGFTLKELFRDTLYEIDYYQREYTWGEEEVRTLLRDLFTSFRNWSKIPAVMLRPDNAPQYFLGPFVYYERARNHRCLVDGQQRFVTLHLLFLRLRALIRDLEYEGHVDSLNRVITTDDRRFAVAISDHEPVLRAISEGRTYEVEIGHSLSRRNLWARSEQIESLLTEELDSEIVHKFVDWLLDRVVLVGIRAVNQDHGYRMFETMNDRGARLTPVDLLKSYLLSNVGSDEDALNTRWQKMLRELTTDRDDSGAPARFIKATLLAHHAGPYDGDDCQQIETNPNVWVRRNSERLGLRAESPERFMEFVNGLLDTAYRYRPFLAASRELKKQDRLEAVFFNERNGLDAQSVAILSALRPDDLASEAKEKGRLVANFIDRWYALRVLQDLPVQARDIAELVHHTLVPDLRECRAPSEVAALLGKLAAQDVGSLRDLRTFGLRGNNRHQVTYILARVTAFVEEKCERHPDVLAYLDPQRYHVEHLWATHHAPVEEEIPDAVVFRSLRNQLGGLGLLPGRENMSLGDKPLQEKLSPYHRQHTLLGILAPGFNVKNPALRSFVNANGLEDSLRPFGPKAAMRDVVETRQRLHLELCELVWDPRSLGFTLPPSEEPGQEAATPPKSAPRKKPGRRTDVAKMVAHGVLPPGTPLVLTHRSVDHWATVDEGGGIVLKATGGTAYGHVDEAGAVVRGTKTCRGMSEWHVVDEHGARTSLRALRDQAQSSGLLTRAGR